MRKILVMLVMAVLGAVLLVGCKDENLVPYFTRWASDTQCGVAPLLVQFTARASGGDREESPTGSNSYLTVDWDFRDGGNANGSIVYHTFTTAGVYDVALSVKDQDGDGETQYIRVDVKADSLAILATPTGDGAEPDTTVYMGDTVQFNVFARVCGFDTDFGNYDSTFLFRWTMDDADTTVYRGRSPRFDYGAEDVGLRQVVVVVNDDQAGVTRQDTVTVQVDWAPTITASAGTDGEISPNGAVVVHPGADQTFTITPASGYHIQDVLVDAVSVGAAASYTFTNVTQDHTIAASFAINP